MELLIGLLKVFCSAPALFKSYISFIFMGHIADTYIQTVACQPETVDGDSAWDIFIYIPHRPTKILAIRLVEMQSHDQRYFAYHVSLTYLWKFRGRPCDSTHGIVLFDGKFFSKGV